MAKCFESMCGNIPAMKLAVQSRDVNDTLYTSRQRHWGLRDRVETNALHQDRGETEMLKNHLETYEA